LVELGGTVLADKYRLVSLLGRGGMGTVYQAEQLGLGRSVAIKLLRRDLIATRFDWFRVEAMAASRINHPHAVAIYDFGISRDGTPYLVMEHLRGHTLGDLIHQQPLVPTQAAIIAAQILSALDEAHACGVVHCDLTATNVIVERRRDGADFAKVIDFGLARLFQREGGVGTAVGTAEYMAPEQIRGEQISPATDLYALGVLLYEMLVGRTPFAAPHDEEVLAGHLLGEPEPPHRRLSSCPEALSSVVMAALEKLPHRRPSTALDMRSRLLAAVPGSGSEPTLYGACTAPHPRRRSTTHPRPLATTTRRSTRLSVELQARSELFGRERELELLTHFCRGGQHSATMAVIGPPGIGKARLIDEAARRQSEQVTTFLASSDPSGARLPWYPVLTMLEAVLGVDGPIDCADLTRAAARCGLPDRDVPGLAELFGIAGPAQTLELATRRREAHAAALRALLAAHRRFPRAVLCFADIDRYDRPSLELVHALAARLDGSNLRLLVTAEEPPTLPRQELLRLAGLTPSSARALLRSLVVKERAIPDAPAVHALTGGVPSAIEQVGGWLAMGNTAASLPSLFVDLVSVRINRLPATARRVLQAAAIHGTVAPRWLVESTLGEEELAVLDQTDWTGLLTLSEEAMTIRNTVVAAVVDACTPADVRRRLHRRALEALGQRGPAAIRARHAEAAGEVARALDLYFEAGHDAVRRFDDAGATVWYERALAMARELQKRGVPSSSRLAGDASILLAEVLRYSGKSGLAIRVLEEAEQFGPDARQRAALERQGALCAEPGEALRRLECAVGLSIRAGDLELLCQCYLDLVRELRNADRPNDARHELEQAIDVITAGSGLAAVRGPERLWRLSLTLAELELLTGNHARAREHAEATLAHVEHCAHTHARGRVRTLLARICEHAGDFRAALEYRSAAIDDLRRLGDRRSTAELLIESAAASRRSAAVGDSEVCNESASAVRLARRLASEIGEVDVQLSELSTPAQREN
jgi:serine/threonine-protein kinase